MTLASARILQFDVFAPSSDVIAEPIIFSHGANAAPGRYRALLAGWVAAGHIVVAPLHLDSEDHPAQETEDRGRVLRTRIEDMVAARYWLGANPSPGLGSNISTKVVAAGHSYGAYIAQIMAGATALDPAGGEPLSVPDPASIHAVIALSPPPTFQGLIPRGSWQDVRAPTLVQTGTADVMPPFVEDWRQHLDCFREAQPGMAMACVYDAVDHYFGGVIGRVNPAAAARMLVQLRRFVQLSTLFVRTVTADRVPLDAQPGFAALCDTLLVDPRQTTS